MTLTTDELNKFNAWAEKFTERSPENGDKNLERAMMRRYGHPHFMITGANDTYTLNIGTYVE